MSPSEQKKPLWKQKWLWISLSFLAVFSTLARVYQRAPYWIADYVNEKFPYVEIRGENVKIKWDKVEVRGARVKYVWAKGTLALVTVDFENNVWVKGGKVHVEPEKKPKGEGPPKESSVQIKGVELDDVTISYKGHFLNAGKYYLNPEHHCFGEGTFSFPLGNKYVDGLSFKAACVNKDLKSMTVNQATVMVRMPSQMPKLGGLQYLKLHSVEVDIEQKLLKTEFFILGDTLVSGNHATLKKDETALYLDILDVRVDHPWLAPSFRNFSHVALDIPLDKDELGRVSFGSASVLYSLEDHHVEGHHSCSDWVGSLPKPTSLALKDAAEHFKGSLNFDITALPTPHVTIKHDCTYACSARPIKDLKSVFEYEVYKADGETLFTRTSGPGSPDWVSLQELPINAASSFIRMEDPSFLSHKGILTASLKVALEQNLEKGYFFRGGSTITQQLAKNLWLKRHKTVGRKIEEAFLTIALESCLSKNEILELYLNVVEMGPNLYGIGPAIKHYFDKDPSEIQIAETYYLASLLPNPKKAPPPDQGGLEKAKRLMGRLADNGLIDRDLIPPDEEDLDTRGWQIE